MNTSSILFSFFFVFWVQFIKESKSTSYQAIDDTCLNNTNVEKLEKCKVCTQKQVGQNSVNDRNCFDGGVHHRFFQCSNEEDYDDMSCDLDKYSTVYDNIVSVSVPAHQNNQTWACYFDLTNGGKDYESRARMYVNQNSGCSNSTTFTIDKYPEQKFWYRIKVTSGAIRGKMLKSNSKCVRNILNATIK